MKTKMTQDTNKLNLFFWFYKQFFFMPTLNNEFWFLI